jgi:hypothetical protein
MMSIALEFSRRVTAFMIAALFVAAPGFAQEATKDADALMEELPAHIRQLTHFGQRADWSHDGKRILFIEKTYGDVFEVEVATKVIRPMTHHYHHEGYTRALYLSNGDILLSGSRMFDADDPTPSRRKTAELWVLDASITKPPVALGSFCAEGPAVSRTKLRIAWAITHENYPDVLPEDASQMWLADISYDADGPALIDKRLLLDSRHIPLVIDLETQNFRPPLEEELIFSGYHFWGGEVMGINIETGHIENYSMGLDSYEEPEGIFPDGEFTTVERVPSQLDAFEGRPKLDIWKLKLDESGTIHSPLPRTWKQLTHFSEYGLYRGTNPVISDDGRFMAFQLAKSSEQAGVGHGIFIYDFSKAPDSD